VPRKKDATQRGDEQLDFEQALRELEALVEKLESGELSLEESLKHFERGVSLTRICQSALENAEQKVQILTEKSGAPRLESIVLGDKNGKDE
jgi:exodeoxyribonuclease VII small subunit